MNGVPRPSHKDIATRCGISTATVSRALAGHPKVRPATRETVLKIARQMGYHRDPRLAYLSRLRWQGGRGSETVRVVVLTDQYTSAPKEDNKFAELNQRAHELGYELEFVSVEATLRQERRYSRQWRHRGICGILVMLHRSDELPRFDWEEFCVVFVGEEFPALPFYRVGTDFRQGFDLMAEKLLQYGKRIGHCFFDYSRNPPHHAGKELSRLLHGEMLLQREELAKMGRSAGPIYQFVLDNKKDKRGFLDWLDACQPDVILTNIEQPVEWSEESNRKTFPKPRFFHLPLRESLSSPSVAGCSFQISRRLALGLTTLHEALLLNRRGYSETPIKLLTPMLWVEPKSK